MSYSPFLSATFYEDLERPRNFLEGERRKAESLLSYHDNENVVSSARCVIEDIIATLDRMLGHMKDVLAMRGDDGFATSDSSIIGAAAHSV
mgnify:CR=1 FL=1